ncbi:MAG: synthase [Patescibacteria group bacterium]|nr:synthase [Patescibacteria group bacterium]
MNKPQFVIIDFGSQYTTIIARTLALLGFRSVITSPEKLKECLAENSPKALILSGGNASVYDENAPTIPVELLNGDYYVLGICYGMQLIAHLLDSSSVQKGNTDQKGYGPMKIRINNEERIFADLQTHLNAWTSHGDIVANLPNGFEEIASSGTDGGKVIEGIISPLGKIIALQFHPEVIQTDDDNSILKNFAGIAKCVPDWNSENAIDEIRNHVLTEVGGGRALLGLSGGVDSTTLAAILAPIMGDNLVSFIIDHGGMREGEIEEVQATMARAGIPINVVKASSRFLKTIGKATDPEEKRKRFMKAYRETFERIISKYRITHMIQGTLATDLIESGKKGKSALIKSHHNIVDFSIPKVEPLSHLFKHEIRAIARSLNLDAMIAERKPFPGPGLYLRILGIPATRNLIKTVQWADKIVTAILKDENCYDEISQLVVALDGTKTTGVKGDARSLAYSIIVRPITTSDFMTVKPMYLAPHVMERITNEITKHTLVNRVFWDYTPKPPATTEFE